MKTKKRKIAIIAVISILGVLLIGSRVTSSSGVSKENDNKLTDKNIQNVVKLSTLRCYYHNTAKYDNPGKFLLIFDNNTRLWIEYTGTVNFFIEASDVKINSKTNGKTVYVDIPHAKMDDPQVDKTSLTDDSYKSTTSGIFPGSIGYEDQQIAFDKAQENMKKTAAKDKSLFKKAEQNAEELIENYIKNIDQLNGIEREVKFNYID